MSYLRKKRIGARDYYYEVESVWKDGKSRQKVVRYVGPVDKVGKSPAAAKPDELTIESSVEYGQVAALHALASQLGLQDAVRSSVAKGGGTDLGKLLELMVLNRCLDPVSRHRLPHWFSRTALPRMLDLPVARVTEDVLYNAMSYFTDDKITRIQQWLWTALKKSGADTSRIFYDITSTYFEGHLVAMAKHGYSRDHRPDKVQINLAIAVNRDGLPVTHLVLDGNVTDVTTVKRASTYLRDEFQVDHAIFVLDRGMMSAGNRMALNKSTTPFIAGVPLDAKMQGVAARPPESRFLQADAKDPRYFVAEVRRGRRRMILVLNKQKQHDDAAWRHGVLEATDAALGILCGKHGTRGLATKAKLQSKAQAILKKYGTTKFVTLSINARGPPRLTWSRNREALEQEARWDGRFLLETNTQLPAAEVFWAYHERDVVEKFMQAIKDIVELRPVYVHTETRVKAHVFVCVTAVLLLQVLRQRLKAAGISLSSVVALERLDSVMEVAAQHGEELVRLQTRRTQEQQSILDAAGVKTHI